MNRIRKIQDSYQVLITPVLIFNTSFELLLGNWPDKNLTGFEIKTFTSEETALCESFKYPDIDWHRLVLLFKDEAEKCKNLSELSDFKMNIMTPEELKNMFFDRVLLFGDSFRLIYHMNDILTFTHEIKDKFTKYQIIKYITKKLFVILKYTENSITYLICKTDLGLTFEIVLI